MGAKDLKGTDTQDQRVDKTKTYDHSRVEYSFMSSVLHVDADELLFCKYGDAGRSQSSQRRYQQQFMEDMVAQGYEEISLMRYYHAGLYVAFSSCVLMSRILLFQLFRWYNKH